FLLGEIFFTAFLSLTCYDPIRVSRFEIGGEWRAPSMQYRIRVPQGADQKVAAWRRTQPGRPADRNGLLRSHFVQLCKDAVALVGAGLNTEPTVVILPGPNDDLFKVAVRLLSRDEIEAVILDLFPRRVDPPGR